VKMVVHLLRADASVVMEVSQDWSIEWPVTDQNIVEVEPAIRHAMADAMIVLASEMKIDAGTKAVNDTVTLEPTEDQPEGWKQNYEA